jgi:hypothetical protein
VGLFQKILNQCANAITVDEAAYTPLYIASRKEHFEVLRGLLNHGDNDNQHCSSLT